MKLFLTVCLITVSSFLVAQKYQYIDEYTGIYKSQYEFCSRSDGINATPKWQIDTVRVCFDCNGKYITYFSTGEVPIFEYEHSIDTTHRIDKVRGLLHVVKTKNQYHAVTIEHTTNKDYIAIIGLTQTIFICNLQEMDRLDTTKTYIELFEQHIPIERKKALHAMMDAEKLYLDEKFAEALVKLEYAVTTGYHNSYTYYLIGCCNYDLEKYPEAVKAFTKLIGMVEDVPGPIDIKSFYIWSWSGTYRYAHSGFHSNVTLERAIELRGYSKFMLEDNRGAIADLERAILYSENPTADMYFTLGHAEYLLGRLEDAKADFEMATKTSPDHGWSHYMLGLTNWRLSDIETACLNWSRAGELGISESYESIKIICD